MSPDEDFELRVTHAMGRATTEFPPHSADLVRRSVARGRRMRILAATRIAAATAAVVTAGSTLLAVGASGHRGDTGQARAGVQQHSTEQQPTRPPASISGEEMVRTLKSLLPPGGTVSAASGTAARSDSAMSRPTAKLTYSTTKGTSGIDLAITRLAAGIPLDQQGQGGCMPVEVRPYDICTTKKLPGGAVLNTTKSFTYPSGNTGQKRWYVTLTTADGVQLTVQEFGGGGEKGASGDVDPLLSLAQLTSIVRSPAWDRAIAALPAREEDSSPTAEKQVSSARMTLVLRSHLSGAGDVSEVNAGDGLVQLIYDDGHGKTMVEVDAQYHRTSLLAGHMGCADVAGDCTATKLPDGTRIKKVRGLSEKGGPATVWSIDVLYPDGRRLVAREINSYSESTPVTRPEPALSMTHLLAIARDERFFTR